MTPFEQTRSINARDNLEREIFPGVYVREFPKDVSSATFGIDKSAAIAQTKGASRSLRQWRLGATILVATGIAAVLSVMALGKLHDKPDGAPTQLNEMQRAQRLHLTTAARTVAVPASQTPFVVLIDPLDEVPATSYLNISGLPPTILLSAGRTLEPGEWLIPLSALSNVVMNVPADVSGEFEVVITLLGGLDETRPTPNAQARTTLVIAPVGESAAPTELASPILKTEPNQFGRFEEPSPADPGSAPALTTAPEPPSEPPTAPERNPTVTGGLPSLYRHGRTPLRRTPRDPRPQREPHY